MVVQKAINNLKDGPKEDKVAVASGIAISVVVVLLAGWAIFFFRNIARNAQGVNLGGGVQSQFNFQSVTQAQQQLQQQYGSGSNNTDLQEIQAQSAAGQTGQMQTVPMQDQGQTTNQFSAPNPSQ
jgi:hypothetical protein